MKYLTLPAVGATLVFILFAALISESNAQDPDYTYCVNGAGEVVIVTNWTCPAGYWPS
jgi:hypothetical protein